MSFLNKIISVVSPSVALNREIAERRYAALSGLSNGSETRWRGASRYLGSFRSWLPILGSGKSDLPAQEKRTLASRSRDAFRNQPIARAAILRPRTAVVGTGIRPIASVDWKSLGITEDESKSLNSAIDRYWRLYAINPRECDAEGTLDAYQLQGLAMVSSMLSGDCFALTPYKRQRGCIFATKLQLVDGARVSNPNNMADTETLTQGIQVDALGAPYIYHIATNHPNDTTAGYHQKSNPVRVYGPRTGYRRALHILNDKTDIGAIRGAPFLAPILEPLLKLERYSRAELTAAVIGALYTVFIESDKDVNEEIDDPTAPFDSSKDEDIPLADDEFALGEGIVTTLGPGQKANVPSPGRPNANYDEFFFSGIKEIGAALEIPAEELLLYYRSSYSAARAGMLKAHQFYLVRRELIQTQLCNPWRAIWFDELVASGKIDVKDYGDPIRRAAYQRVAWTGPARGAIDELREAKAAVERINGRLSNRRVETQQMLGEDWDVIADGLADEQQIMTEKKILPGDSVPFIEEK